MDRVKKPINKPTNNKPEKTKDNKPVYNENEILPRIPVKCPLTNCNQVMGTAEILAHYLRDHGTQEFEYREVTDGAKSLMVIELKNLKYGKNTCLGMLVYGRNFKLGKRSAHGDFSRPNSFLPEGHERLYMHLPILLMVCKKSSTSFINDEDYKAQVTDPSFLDQHIFVFWLTTVETRSPINGTITLFDKFLKVGRSKIMVCRKLSDSQNIDDFIKHDPNYILLRYGEMRKLTHNNKNCINLEVVINDYNT